MAIENAYTSLLMKHSLSTHNRRQPDGTNLSQEAALPSCGDEIMLFLQIEDGVIADAGFDGYGCAISQASASVMLDLMRGRTLEQADALVGSFLAMMDGIPDEEEYTALGEATILREAAALPGRSGCAAMAWHTLRRMLREYAS